MAYINDKNLPYLVEKLNNADNIKINNNKHGSRVSTVINSLVAKSDNITKVIEQEVINDSYSFKVGTGDVDISTDVQDGFGEVGIKGVTYQNILNDFSIGSETSKYVTANGNTIKWTKPIVTTFNTSIKYHNSLAQFNKTYTLVFYIYKNTLQMEGAGDSYNVAKFNIVSYDYGCYTIPVNKTGLVKVKLIQPTTTRSDGKPYLEVYKGLVGEFEISYPILLEGDHTNNPNLPSYFEGIVGIGDKSKNLFNSANLEIGSSEDVNNRTWSESKIPNLTRVRSISEINVKPNTTYTLNTTKKLKCVVKQFNAEGIGIADMPWTEMPYTFTTKTNTNSMVFMIKYEDDREVELNDIIDAKIQLEEGSTSTNQPDGTYKIEILSCGKNLLPYDNVSFGPSESTWWDALEQKRHYKGAPTWETSKSWFYLPEGNYKFTYKQLNNCSVQIIDRDENLLNMNGFFKGGDISVRIRNIDTALPFGYEEMQIERVNQSNSSSTPYVPYISDKVQILLDKPLMRLPNGVCDEITMDGKLIRRIGKIVCTGEEPGWNYWPQFDSTDYISFHVNVSIAFGLPEHPNKAFIDTEAILSDKFFYESVASANTMSEGIMIRNASPNYIGIRIKKSRLANYSDSDTADVKISKLRTWLNTNNFTLYYLLLIPEVTQLNPISVRTFKDGHIIFNTLVAPESTHKVQLNKSAQIESTNKEVNRLENRVINLESFYDDVLLETNYKLALLNYDFEYIKEREDE